MKWLVIRGLLAPVAGAVIGVLVDRGILAGQVGDALLALVRAVAVQLGL